MKALPLLQRWWSAPFVRAAVWGALGLAATAGGIVLAYELALARVPQHRETLERLVRAHTGLDVRFDELNLRWGWYGPEAVFHRVELGEPGLSDVLVRAPQLIIGFDAWRSVRSGKLQAGRVTFVAPDVNLQRRSGIAGVPAARDAASQNRARLLQRWRGGRIEFEGGTLRLPDPAGSSEALALQIRRASLRRSENEWSASALVFLPERLGHTARVAAQLEGDLTQPAGLQGSVRFDGLRLAFAGWRHVFGPASAVTRQLPSSGSGDISFRVTFDHGRVQKADGRVRAQEISFRDSPGFLAPGQRAASARGLSLPRLRGSWRLAHRDSSWQLRVEELDLGANDGKDALPGFSLDVGAAGQWVRGDLGDVQLGPLAALATWLAPHIDLTGMELKGVARDTRFDWDDSRPPGLRLRASTRADALSFAPASRNFTLEGCDLELSASETDIDLTLDAKHARLVLAHATGHPLEDLRIASELRLTRRGDGWHLSTPLLTVDHEAAQLILSGSLTAIDPEAAPQLDLRATLVRAGVPLLRELLGDEAAQRFGAPVSHLVNGRIERAQFHLQSAPGSAIDARAASAPQLFAGSLALRDGQIAGSEFWPEIQGLDARLEWNRDRMNASIERGRAGSMELDSASAHWSVLAARETRVSGRVRGRLEDALQWLVAHPRLEEHMQRLRDFAVSGDALFNFDVTLAVTQRRKQPAVARVRVATLLDGAELHLTQDLPPIRSVRGSLAFDAGRLQLSTLTGRWLGGPVAMRVSERRDRRGNALAIQAQGLLEARQLAALTGLEPLPEVAGETPWTGELVYQPQDGARAARWQLDADASLVGVSSRLPEPLAKAVVTAVPLRVVASGAGSDAEVEITVGNRLKSRLALARGIQGKTADSRWRVARGAISFGPGAATVPSEPVIAVQGQMARLDFPAYASLWQRAGNLASVPVLVADLIAEQLWLAGRMFPGVRVQARKAAGLPVELDLASPEFTGTVRWPAARAEVHLEAQTLDAAERARIVAQLRDSWNDSTVTVN